MNELKAFNKANFSKYYGSMDGWHSVIREKDAEEVKIDKLMTLLLLDTEVYGWSGSSAF